MEDVLEKIRESIKNFDRNKVMELTEEGISKNIDPIKLLDTFKEVLNQFGEEFEKKNIFLPELVGVADTVEDAMPIVIKEIENKGKKVKSLGKVAIGTVKGDIHTIGKAMVATLLTAEGFIVKDLGIDVPAEKFIEAVRKDRVDILAMSSLLTTTYMEQKKVIELLKEENLRDKVRIIVGGGAITKEFSEEIGADGYDQTAPGAVELAKKLLLIKK